MTTSQRLNHLSFSFGLPSLPLVTRISSGGVLIVAMEHHVYIICICYGAKFLFIEFLQQFTYNQVEDPNLLLWLHYFSILKLSALLFLEQPTTGFLKSMLLKAVTIPEKRCYQKLSLWAKRLSMSPQVLCGARINENGGCGASPCSISLLRGGSAVPWIGVVRL